MTKVYQRALLRGNFVNRILRPETHLLDCGLRERGEAAAAMLDRRLRPPVAMSGLQASTQQQAHSKPVSMQVGCLEKMGCETDKEEHNTKAVNRQGKAQNEVETKKADMCEQQASSEHRRPRHTHLA